MQRFDIKNLAAIALLAATLVPAAQAFAADKVMSFTGNIKADKIQPGNKIYVQCVLRDQANAALAGMSQTVGNAGPDGTFNGPFSVGLTIPAATMAQIGPKITGWRCSALQESGAGSVGIAGGATPSVQGNF